MTQRNNYFIKFRNNLGIKKYTPHNGWLELFTDSYLSGWAYIKDKKLKSIKLFYQNRLLGESVINEDRFDVNQELNINLPTGFKLPISGLNEKMDIDQLIFEVSDLDNKYFVKLKFLKKFSSLKTINSNSFLSNPFQGKIDGYETMNTTCHYYVILLPHLRYAHQFR